MTTGRLEGKVAVITGGASGIGEATVRLFKSHGAQVVIADVQDDRGRRLAEELGPAVAYARTDVREERAIAAAIELAVTRWGRLDCLFNNAGAGGVTGGIESISAEDFDDHHGPARARRPVRHEARRARDAAAGVRQHHQHRQRRRPARRLRASRLQRGQGRRDPAHAAIAIELAATGSASTASAPAPSPRRSSAPRSDSLRGRRRGRGPREGHARRRSSPRPGRLPEDVAHAALWLGGDESSFVTGQAIVVDGGITAGRPWSENKAMGARIRDALGVMRRR